MVTFMSGGDAYTGKRDTFAGDVNLTRENIIPLTGDGMLTRGR